MAKGNVAIAASEDKKWKAENDMRTLREAEEIKKDPARLKSAQGMAVKHIEELRRIKNV